MPIGIPVEADSDSRVCTICAAIGVPSEHGPCEHLRFRLKCQLPTCREQDPGECIGCIHKMWVDPSTGKAHARK